MKSRAKLYDGDFLGFFEDPFVDGSSSDDPRLIPLLLLEDDPPLDSFPLFLLPEE